MIVQMSVPANPVVGNNINVDILRNYFDQVANNFHIANSNTEHLSKLVDRLKAYDHLLKWLMDHSPEVLTAYEAHTSVTRRFDKASSGTEGVEVQAA
jgi:predicted transcriptional regulator